MNAAPCLIALLVSSAAGSALADPVDTEPAAILEIGGATNTSQQSAATSLGPAFAVEVTPIENWLELEAGVTPTFRRHATEWDTDLLFKKPWTLSERLEFMLGIGPEWVHTNEYGRKANSAAIEGALDFMFWPSAKHRFGWYLEPGYDYAFGRGHDRSVGISVGLLIAIR